MTINVGPAARKLLAVLQKYAPHGQMFAPRAHRGRRAIVVPEYDDPGPRIRVDAMSLSTLWELERVGLIEVAREYTPSLNYQGRRHGDDPDGQLVTLLAAGRATCPTCLVVGSMDCTFRRKPTPGWRHSTRPPVPDHLQ